MNLAGKQRPPAVSARWLSALGEGGRSKFGTSVLWVLLRRVISGRPSRNCPQTQPEPSFPDSLLGLAASHTGNTREHRLSPALSQNSCVTLGDSLHLSELQFLSFSLPGCKMRQWGGVRCSLCQSTILNTTLLKGPGISPSPPSTSPHMKMGV